MGLDWLEEHLLPCPFKSLTGMDCPGCGLQRSFMLLLRGDLSSSFHLYPALFPLLLMMVVLALHLKYRFRKGAAILQVLFFFTLGTILVSYIFRQTHSHFHG